MPPEFLDYNKFIIENILISVDSYFINKIFNLIGIQHSDFFNILI